MIKTKLDYSVIDKERKRIGQDLRKMRNQLGLTCQEVGEDIGLHYSRISRTESGKSTYMVDMLILLTVYYQTVAAEREAKNAKHS